MYSIYIHRFPNGKVYIGCTGLDLHVRFGKNGGGYKTQERMWNVNMDGTTLFMKF